VQFDGKIPTFRRKLPTRLNGVTTHIFHSNGCEFQISQLLGFVTEQTVRTCKANSKGEW